MARTADTQLVTHVAARDLHAGDTIRAKDGADLWVHEVKRTHGMVRVTVVADTQDRTWSTYTLDPDRMVPALTETPCDCNGSGIHHGAGYVENGVFKGRTGVHFACGGKGWQDRADTIRNRTYWAKHARISA